MAQTPQAWEIYIIFIIAPSRNDTKKRGRGDKERGNRSPDRSEKFF